MTIIIIAYLLGSIPFGLLLAKLKGIDLRKGGSGNIGATNALRLGGRAIGVSTLLLDIAKGALAVCIAEKCDHNMINWAALSVVLGHVYPVWLRFKGGKGVATAAGAILFLNWQVCVIAVATWIVSFKVSKISSLSAIVACLCAGISIIWLVPIIEQQFTIAIILALIVWRHHDNIKRLLSGEELIFKAKHK